MSKFPPVKILCYTVYHTVLINQLMILYPEYLKNHICQDISKVVTSKCVGCSVQPIQWAYITQSDTYIRSTYILCIVVKQVTIKIVEDKFGNFYTKVITTLIQGILMIQ